MKSTKSGTASQDKGTKGLRASLQAAISQLDFPGAGVAERMAMAEAYFRLAVMQDTQVDESIELMRRAIDCDAYHPKLLFHLGRLLHMNGDPRAAVLEYRRVLRLVPGNHRVLVHLALALNDSGSEEKHLGKRALWALAGSDEASLNRITEGVDTLIAGWVEPEKKKPPASTAKDGKFNGSGNGNCRWRGLWKLFLMQELSRDKLLPKNVIRHLDSGRALVDKKYGAAEYLTACLLFVLNRRNACRDLETRLQSPVLAEQKDRPVMKLAAAVCELGAAEDPEDFVSQASALLKAERVPPELVCCLHYCWYGQMPDTDPTLSVALIELYPESVRNLPCFRELRIAILEHHAQVAWTAGRIDRARILWQECFALDPTRISLAHNLAVAATKERAEEQYAAAWDRAIELRYLLAAAASDMRVDLEDRTRLHSSFAQQSRIRFLKSDATGRREENQQEMKAWMEDGDALIVWLREWALYYLNSRLRFHSPMHLLGVGLDCSDEDADAGCASLVQQLELCFKDCGWAGTGMFHRIVETLAIEACARAKNPLLRRRDRHFEAELDEAKKLNKEATEHGFLLFNLLCLAADSSSVPVQRSGLQAARHLMNMPWRSLEALWRATGGTAEDRLPVIFSSYLIKLAKESGPQLSDLRLQVLTDCIKGSPDVHELRLYVCGLQLEGGKYSEAYNSALAGFELSDRESEANAKKLQNQYANILDRAALAQLPEELRQPSPSQLSEFSKEVERILAVHPQAGGLRLMWAQLLIRSSDEDPSSLAEATRILEESLDQLITDEQVQKAQQLLERAGAKSEATEAFSRVRAMLETAAKKIRTALEEWRKDRTPAKAREALNQLESAREELLEAEQIAAAAKLASAAGKAQRMIEDLEKLRDDISRS